MGGSGIDIADIVRRLSELRPTFHSEADLQHSIAWLIHERFPAANIRLEVPVVTHLGTLYVDILVHLLGRTHVIELKYKTRALTTNIDGETFRLQSHVALPLGRYDVLKDLQRVESVSMLGDTYFGTIVFLTNESAYWSAPRLGTETSAEFSLGDGRELHGRMEWTARASDGTKKKREEPIVLSGNYEVDWQEYSSVQSDSYSRFRFLVLDVADDQGDLS